MMDIAELSAMNRVDDGLVSCMPVQPIAQAHSDFRLRAACDDLCDALGVGRQRFLQQQVLAGFCSSDGLLGMQFVRRGDDDRVERGILQQ